MGEGEEEIINMKNEIIQDKTKNEVRKIVCKYCDNTTNHNVLNSVERRWGNEDIQGIDVYETITCSGCDSVSFRKSSSNSEDTLYDDEGGFSYPESEEIYPSRLMGRKALQDIYSLPDKVRVMYSETHRAIFEGLKILAGIGVRALVEGVCSEESAQGHDLKEKINDLVLKGVLTQKNADILHKIRLFGNRAAHEMNSASDSELDVALDIVENLLETVYIIPKKAERLK